MKAAIPAVSHPGGVDEGHMIKTLVRLHEEFDNPKWSVNAGGETRVFTESRAHDLRSWVAGKHAARQEISFVPPTVSGNHWFVVAKMPRGQSRPADCSPSAQFVFSAGNDYWLLWLLLSPVSETQAKAIARRLVTRLGGKPAVGELPPLPGTIFAQTSQVTCMFPVGVRAYRALGDHLEVPPQVVSKQSAPPRPAPMKVDPGLMAVRLSDDAVWQPGAQSNGFMLVLGASGSGKTESLKTIAKGIHDYSIPVLMLDFHGDVVLPGVPSTVLSSAPSSKVGLNPLEVDVESAKENGLYDQRTAIMEMVSRAVPQLGYRQLNALHNGLEGVYRSAGIIDEDPSSWTRPSPTLTDLMSALQDDGLIAGVRGLLGHPIFSRTQHLTIEEMLAKSSRLDLSKLPEGVRYITAETLLRRLFTALRMRGPIPVTPKNDTERFRLFIVIDEARLITMGGNSDIVKAIVNEARKFGLGLLLASQTADHFPHDVLNNSGSWLVLKPQAMAEAKKNAPNVGVEPDDLMKLRGRGDGYFRDQSSPTARRIQVRPVSG